MTSPGLFGLAKEIGISAHALVALLPPLLDPSPAPECPCPCRRDRKDSPSARRSSPSSAPSSSPQRSRGHFRVRAEFPPTAPARRLLPAPLHRTPRYTPRGPNRAASHAPVLRWRSPARRSQSASRSEEHTSELQSLRHLVCRLLL